MARDKEASMILKVPIVLIALLKHDKKKSNHYINKNVIVDFNNIVLSY